jgi:hypothetical protein
MLNCREFLAQHESSLTVEQKKRLQVADKQILSLVSDSYEVETPDVGFLKLTADVIDGNRYNEAA